MTISEHRRLAEQLLALHRGPLLILPNAWDAFSAALMEAVGFKAVATTSAGVYVGACGVNLEDGVGASHQPRPLEEACERIAAARQAATKLGVPLVINARTDVYLSAGNNDPSLLESALTRAKAYVVAGADCVYPIGLVDIEQIKRFVAELKHPVNIHGRRGTPPIPVLQAAGVARVSTATTPAVFVAGALSDAMTKLIQSGSFEHFASSFDYARLQKMFAARA
jgi:2-methylisocitrate lyase-like PEP mutase family enzyme